MFARSPSGGLFFVVLSVISFSSPGAAQTTWYVDINGTAPGAGTQADPYTGIQYAIAQASTSNGDTVLVLPGIYVENLDFLGKALRVVASAGQALTTIDGGGPIYLSAVSFTSG